ncbi:MAG: hypothetical protein AAGH76_07635 [Pseudomonadota bacterium]
MVVAQRVLVSVFVCAMLWQTASAQVVDIWSIYLNQQPEVEEEVEHELSESFDVDIPLARLTLPCEGKVELTYDQFDDVARVDAKLTGATCPVSRAEYALIVNVRDRDDNVVSERHEFAWEADSEQPFPGSASYPIGADADLISVRARRFSCQCAAGKEMSVTADADDGSPPNNNEEPLWF